MTIPETFLQELLSRVDVVNVVGRYVPLKKGGANFMGLCPFHGEKSPSFSVSAHKQFFHCFGCGQSGNAITFLMQYTGMGFLDAVQELAQGVGLTVPQARPSSAQEREHANAQRQQKMRLCDVLERAGAAWRQHLKNSPHAITYLKQRGVLGTSAQRYGLGYAPSGWHHLASVFAHYDDPLLQEAGLVVAQAQQEPSPQELAQRRYDRFRDRIMFPIRNVKGECIGFGARALGEEKPKYLNSPETPTFHKGRELYGLFEARQAIREQGYVLVTEGYMDVIMLAQAGFAHAVATLGTACTPDHLHKLFRFTDQVVFSFDGDRAGRRAARKALEAALPHLSDTRSVKFVFLPAEHDPDSFLRAHGANAFAQCIGAAVPLSRFWLDAARDGRDVTLPEGRSFMAHNAFSLWQPLPQGAFKTQLLNELGQHTQMSPEALLASWQAPQHKPVVAMPPVAAPTEGSQRQSQSQGHWKKRAASSPPFTCAPSLRPAPSSRADHAARLLLSNTAFWEALTPQEKEALCRLPAPHDALFAWLESEILEYGPLPWAQLRERLHGQTCQALALQLMSGPHAQPTPPSAQLSAQLESRQELRGVLDRILIEHLKQQESQAVQRLSSDPHPQIAHYLRQLQAQRMALQEKLV